MNKVRMWLTPLKILWILAILSLGISFWLWWQWDIPLESPLNGGATIRFLTGQTSQSTSDKVIYGFLPYWNLGDVTLQTELTHLSYFSLTIGANGKVILREDDYLEPGYNKLQSDELFELLAAQENIPELELVFSQFNNDDIVTFLSSPQSHQAFLESVDSLILAYPITGINIDIEYSGEVSDRLRERYVEFLQTLNDHLDQRYGNITLSIDMYASAANRYLIWDVPAIAPHVDYIVVMAYDFHRRSSTVAGPVAPLFGGKELWDSDISQQLQAFLKDVPGEKILLGVPFYGYEWQTNSREAQAHTFPDTGATASFKRVQTLLEQKEKLAVEEHWNDDALSPYISYKEDGDIYVVYYENSRSISYKLDFVNQLDLGGIAIWALGYEGDSRELWEVVDRKF